MDVRGGMDGLSPVERQEQMGWRREADPMREERSQAMKEKGKP